MRRSEFIAGKVAPNALISTFDAAVLWLLAVLHFGAPFKGQLLRFALAMAFYVLAATGLGLVVSLLVRTEAAALMIVSVLGTSARPRRAHCPCMLAWAENEAGLHSVDICPARCAGIRLGRASTRSLRYFHGYSTADAAGVR